MKAHQVATFVLVASSLLVLARSENLPVTCGSTIKLKHVATNYRLHSHEIAYSRGSQQQSVTGYPSSDDAGSYWLVLGTPSQPCVPGEAIKKNQVLRLQHVGTKKWLHSHHFSSPLSGQMEVSAFGGEHDSDTGDFWTVEWDGKGKMWKQEQKVRLKHQETEQYLYSHEAKFGHPISNQHECIKVVSIDVMS